MHFVYRGTPKYVLLGEHDLTNDKNDRPLRIEIAEKMSHPEFRRAAKYFDIALVRMSIRVTFSRYLRPACLPEFHNTGTERAIATGWGRTDYRGSSSQVLMKVILELFSDDECNVTYLDASRTTQLRYGILPAQQFCAGSHTEKKDTCQVRRMVIRQTYSEYHNVCYFVISFAGRFGRSSSNLSPIHQMHVFSRWDHIICQTVR